MRGGGESVEGCRCIVFTKGIVHVLCTVWRRYRAIRKNIRPPKPPNPRNLPQPNYPTSLNKHPETLAPRTWLPSETFSHCPQPSPMYVQLLTLNRAHPFSVTMATHKESISPMWQSAKECRESPISSPDQGESFPLSPSLPLHHLDFLNSIMSTPHIHRGFFHQSSMQVSFRVSEPWNLSVLE